MRILYVTDFLPHARSDQGGAKLVDWYMRKMRSRGHEVDLLCLCQPKDVRFANEVSREWGLCDIVVVENTYLRRARSFLGSFVQTEARSYCASAGFFRRAQRLFRSQEFDAVHAVHPWLIGIADDGLKLGRRHNTRLIGEVFNINCILLERKLRARFSVRLAKDYAWSLLSEYENYMRADAILTHTEADSTEIKKHTRGRVPIRDVPAWFDAIDQIVMEPPPKAATRDFLVVGTSADPLMRGWVEWLLAHVWPTIHGRFPDARLKLISVRPEHQALWAGIPGVEPVGYVEDLIPHYDSAAALVFPLSGGGSGPKLKVLNAVARGLPVVMTSAANTTGPLQNEIQAAIRDDAVGFIEAMSRLLLEPDYGRNLATEALRWLRKRYVDINIADQIETLYDARRTSFLERQNRSQR